MKSQTTAARCPESTHASRLARRQQARAQLARHIEELVATAPPLTPQQCTRLVRTLTGGDPA